MTGPFETEQQARETAAVQEIHRAFRADPGVGKMAPLTAAMLTDACTMSGVELARSTAGCCPGCPGGNQRRQLWSAG